MTRFLSTQEVIEIHDQMILEFGGSQGLRDLGLLSSAIEMPRAQMNDQFLHPSLFDQTAAYLFHLSRNHPFIDGNKRTAAAACLIFLEDNHKPLSFDPYHFEKLVVQTAAGGVGKNEISSLLSRWSS